MYILVSSARHPPTYYAGLARNTVKESPKDFIRLVIERCEVRFSVSCKTFQLKTKSRENIVFGRQNQAKKEGEQSWKPGFSGKVGPKKSCISCAFSFTEIFSHRDPLLRMNGPAW